MMTWQAAQGVAPVLRHGVQMKEPICSCFCNLPFRSRVSCLLGITNALGVKADMEHC